MNDWLIRNADIVNEGRRFHGDVRVRAGRIDQVAGELAPRPGEREFDARGRLLVPGMIDDQVHFREPGLEHKGDFHAESRAAVAGGVTSFFEMPNSKPTTPASLSGLLWISNEALACGNVCSGMNVSPVFAS